MPESIALTIIIVILVTADIVGNSLVCLIVKKHRDMRTPINYLLVNLAVADIMFATFLAPTVIFSLALDHPDGTTGSVLCKLVTGGNVAWIGGASSIVTLVIIAIERYYAVVHPFESQRKLTKRRLKLIIPCSWTFSLILTTPLFLVRNRKGNSCEQLWPEDWMAKAYSSVWLVLVIITLALMVALYTRVVNALWCKQDNSPTNIQKGVMKSRKRATFMVVTVSFLFGICWGTESVEFFLRAYTSLDISSLHVAIADTMVVFNSALNPFIFALMNHQFKEKIKRMFICDNPTMARIHAAENLKMIQLNKQPTNNIATQYLSHSNFP